MLVMILHTWQFIVLALAGWLNRQQQDIVAYLQEENRVLREPPIPAASAGRSLPSPHMAAWPFGITAWPGDNLITASKQVKCLLITRSVVESPTRPTALVGERLSARTRAELLKRHKR